MQFSAPQRRECGVCNVGGLDDVASVRGVPARGRLCASLSCHHELCGGRREATGLAICSHVQDRVNGLADFTFTRCFPALANGYGFVIISEQPVFATPAAKKAWLVTVVAALGKEMNDRSLSGGEMLLSDVANTKRRVAWSLSVPLARSLQRRVSTGKIDLDEMYASIIRELKRVNTATPSP